MVRGAGSRSCSTTWPTHTSPEWRLVRGSERLDEADRLDLAQRPAEHRVRDRLQQALAHLAQCRSGSAGSGACCRRAADARITPPSARTSCCVLALGVDDLAAAAEHAASDTASSWSASSCRSPACRARACSRSRAPRARRAATGHRRTTRRAGPSRCTRRGRRARPRRPRGRRPGSARSRAWWPARSPGRREPPEPAGRALGELAPQRTPRARAARAGLRARRGAARARARAAHRSPRHSGRV